MNDYPGKERRKYPRLRVDFTVIYRVEEPVAVRMTIGAREVYALMLDLSEGGMALSTDCNIPIDTTLLIKFTLINLNAEGDERAKTMNIVGAVRNNIMLSRSEYRLGVLFKRIKNEDRSTIAEFVIKSHGH